MKRRRWRLLLALGLLVEAAAGLPAQEKSGEGVKELIAKLRSERSYDRSGAADALGQMESAAAAAAPELAKILASDEYDYARSRAAEALGKIGIASKEVVDALAKALQDDDRWVRYEAAKSLQKLGPPARGAGRALVRALGDRENASEIFTALEKIGATPQDVLPTLRRILRDGESDLRPRILRYLESLGPAAAEAVPELIDTIKGRDEDLLCDSAIDTLASIGPVARAATPPLLAYANASRNLFAAYKVGKALNRIRPGEEEVVPGLLLSLKSRDLVTRRSASAILGQLTHMPGAVPALITALRDDNPAARYEAAEALASHGPRARLAVATLAAMLRGEADPKMRTNAAWCLEGIGPAAARAVPALQAALRDRDDGVRLVSARALGQIELMDPGVIRSLAPLLDDPDEGVRKTCAESLSKAGYFPPEVLADLGGRLGRGAARDRIRAAYVLQGLGPVARDALPAIRAALHDEDPALRLAVLNVLQKMGPAAATTVADLRGLLKVPGKEERQNALRALSSIGPFAAAALPDEIALLSDKDLARDASTALSRMGPAAVPPLLAALKHEDLGQRTMAARTLTALGPATPEVLPALLEALKEQEDPVRAEVALALWKLYPSEGRAAIPTLLTALKASKAESAQAAIMEGLGGYGPQAREAMTEIRGRLGHQDKGLRTAAAAAAASIDANSSTDAIPILMAAVERDDISGPDLRAATALARLGAAGRPAMAALRRVFENPRLNPVIRWTAAEGLERFGVEAVPILAGVVGEDGDELVRIRAAEILARMGEKARAAVPPLIEAHYASNRGVRRAVAEALGRIGPAASNAVPALRDGLGDWDAMDRCLFARTILQIEPARSREVMALLDDAIKSELPPLRFIGARALLSGEPPARAAGIAVLSDGLRSDKPVDRMLVLLLAAGPDDGIGELSARFRALRDDPDELVRFFVVNAKKDDGLVP